MAAMKLFRRPVFLMKNCLLYINATPMIKTKLTPFVKSILQKSYSTLIS